MENPQLPEFDSEIDISGLDSSQVLDCLEIMILIRKVEDRIATARKQGVIGGPVHLAAGQEAIPVGISAYLRDTDKVFSAHRSHAHLIALTKNPHKLFAEVIGRSTGHSRGYGGSMHLWAGESGFAGSVPIVAGTVPLALGTSMSSKLKKSDEVSVAYFGDGAMEEGVVHESLNLASQLKLPVLFVCENNFFSSHMHISQRQPSVFNSRFAQANKVDFTVIDGNDISAVLKSAASAIARIRETGEPFFIEAFTYRIYGHVDWREDIDVGVNRSELDLERWRDRDPIKRLEKEVLKSALLTQEMLLALKKRLDNEVEEAWLQANADPLPKPEELLKHVYKELS